MEHARISCFEPSTLKMLQEVFRASWEAVEHTAPAPATREILARRIMACAADGETDPQKLMAHALEGIRFDPPLISFLEWMRFGSPSHRLDMRMSRMRAPANYAN
jgi:hypothetical protein